MFSLTCNGKPQIKIFFRTKRQTTSGTTRIGCIIINVNDEQQVGGKSGIQSYKRQQKKHTFSDTGILRQLETPVKTDTI